MTPRDWAGTMAGMIRTVEHDRCPGLPHSRHTVDENSGESGGERVGFITPVETGAVLTAAGR